MLINNYENIDDVKQREEKEKEEVKLRQKQELERIKNKRHQLAKQREIEKNNLIIEKNRIAQAKLLEISHKKNTKSRYKPRTERFKF